MSTPPSQPVTIIGAGLSGLVLGQCLRRREIPARIFQRVNESKTHNNYGITLHRGTFEPLLAALGMEEKAFLNLVAIRKPSSGEIVADASNLRVNRGALTRMLGEGLNIKWDHQLSGFRQELAGGTASFRISNDITDSLCGWVIAADGVHSQTRKSLKVPYDNVEPETLPYVVFNGKRRIDKRLLEDDLRHGLEQSFEHPDGITHHQDNVILSIKADFWDATKQQLAISYTLSRPAKPSDGSLLDRSANDAERLARLFKDEIAKLRQLPKPFDAVFNPLMMERDRLLHWLLRTSLFDSSAAQRIATQKGVILVGDAAHAQPVVGGNGANLAIIDAIELANHIKSARDIDAAAFYDSRTAIWSRSKESVEAKLQADHSELHANASL